MFYFKFNFLFFKLLKKDATRVDREPIREYER
jgi:hypothetical protein